MGHTVRWSIIDDRNRAVALSKLLARTLRQDHRALVSHGARADRPGAWNYGGGRHLRPRGACRIFELHRALEPKLSNAQKKPPLNTDGGLAFMHRRCIADMPSVARLNSMHD